MKRIHRTSNVSDPLVKDVETVVEGAAEVLQSCLQTVRFAERGSQASDLNLASRPVEHVAAQALHRLMMMMMRRRRRRSRRRMMMSFVVIT